MIDPGHCRISRAFSRTRAILACACAVALAGLLGLSSYGHSASAQATETAGVGQPPIRGPLGTTLSLISGLCVPPEGGRLGLPLSGGLHYAIALGRAVVAPGLRVASFFVPGAVALAGLGELRVTLPLSQLAPYVGLGIGPGYRSAPGELGLAYQASPGLMVAVSQRLSVGLEASYFQIVGSHFRRLSFGPSFSLQLGGP